MQAIGGVNEKIEGFFDICNARGLTGEQGVLIPQSNVKHLMLRGDVVEACAAGRFHVWPVGNVDEAIELLTGTPAGIPDEQGVVPEGSVNYRVAARLIEFSSLRQAYASRSEAKPRRRAGAKKR
jgi:predicted ATP-dependent protease